jgi:hypothetical protein
MPLLLGVARHAIAKAMIFFLLILILLTALVSLDNNDTAA